MKIKLLFIILPVLFMFISSCDNNLVISESKTIESGMWDTDEVIEFNVSVTQIDKLYNFFIESDIYEDFLTSNLWLFIYTQSPSGNIQSDTLMYFVADEKGKWFGKKTGKNITNKFLYKSSIQFSEPGTYKISLQHGMREHDLPKISKIGIRIEETIMNKNQD